MDHSFFAGRRVLVTGHTGFKGSWLCLWLEKLKAKIAGISLASQYSPLLYSEASVSQSVDQEFFCDLADHSVVEQLFRDFKPEIVFHLAAQAILRKGYRDPLGTWRSNVMGTLSVLEAARRTRETRVVVVCTSDKVYEAFGELGLQPFKESDRLGGHDPYSSSKAAVEIAVDSWRRSYLKDSSVSLSTARSGNVIGGGDWGAHRLIPNAVKAICSGEPATVFTKYGVRPWQHVISCLDGYMTLAQSQFIRPGDFCQAYNFGPAETCSAEEMVQLLIKHWGEGSYVHRSAPNSHLEIETDVLRLDVTKSEAELGWKNSMDLETAVHATAWWYKKSYLGEPQRDLCLDQIEQYG